MSYSEDEEETDSSSDDGTGFPSSSDDDSVWPPRPQGLDVPDTVCDKCQNVKWAHAAKPTKYLIMKNKQLIPFGKPTRSCKVCRFLSRIKEPWQSSSDGLTPAKATNTMVRPLIPSSTRKLSQHRMLCTGDPEDPDPNDRIVAVLDNSWDKLDLAPRRLEPVHIDFGVFKKFITLCEREHTQCRPDIQVDNVSGLRVIHIPEGKVVPAPRNCCYCTLSYVWGGTETSSEGGLASAPLVVADAMSVAAALGCEYLWVDRYCIDQDDDSPEKLHMIQQMDRVYANAFVTIIAASGKDANAGLPGVSQVRRRQQPEVRVGDITLLALPVAHRSLKDSKWVTRAWTYQEGYFSKRRLIFTNEQVLFLCNTMYMPESLRCPINHASLQWSIPEEFEAFIPNYDHSWDTMSKFDRARYEWKEFREVDGIFFRGRLQTELRLFYQIEEYSNRDLSNPKDALNALLGVLNHYHSDNSKTFRQNRQISHLLGIPVIQYRDSLDVYLLWKHFFPAKRRPGFPSWSWTGWEGRVSLIAGDVNIKLDPKSPVSSRPCTIAVEEQEDQKRTTIADFVRIRLAELRENVFPSFEPKRLWISCLAASVEIRSSKPSQRAGDQVTQLQLKNSRNRLRTSRVRYRDLNGRLGVFFPVCKDITIGVRGRFDHELVEHSKDMQCLVVRWHIYSSSASYTFLLVKKLKEDEYERSGIINVEFRANINEFGAFNDDGMVFLDSKGNPLLDESLDLRAYSVEDLFKEGFEEKTICLV